MKEHKVDRTGWKPGPWDGEPDRLEWRTHGLPCLIVRNDLGGLCGYVGVPPGHPWYKQEYDNVDASAHGGLTYSAACSPESPICHIPQPGESDDVWWVGFDCGHYMDLLPGMTKYPFERGPGTQDSYRDVAYVQAEVNQLAEQAIKAKETHAESEAHEGQDKFEVS
jgi:hypothetical protein